MELPFKGWRPKGGISRTYGLLEVGFIGDLYQILIWYYRSFAGPGHMVQNYIYWWASCIVGLPNNVPANLRTSICNFVPYDWVLQRTFWKVLQIQIYMHTCMSKALLCQVEEEQDSLFLKYCFHWLFFSTVCVEKQANKSSHTAEKTGSDGQQLPVQQIEKTVQGESMTNEKAKVGSINKLIQNSYRIVLSRAFISFWVICFFDLHSRNELVKWVNCVEKRQFHALQVRSHQAYTSLTGVTGCTPSWQFWFWV